MGLTAHSRGSDCGVSMATKTVNGKYRLVILLDETDYRDVDAEAKAAGLTRNDVVRLRIRRIETTRRAA